MCHEQGGMNMVREVQNIFSIEQKQIVKKHIHKLCINGLHHGSPSGI